MKNNWQGELYLMLDLVEKWNLAFDDVVAFAFKCGQMQVALRILRKCADGASLRKKDADGRTLLHLFAMSDASWGEMNNAKIGVVDKLFAAGIPPSAVDRFGCNFLHYCFFNHACSLAPHCLLKIQDPAEIQRIFAARSNALKQTVVHAAVWRLGARGGQEKAANSEAANAINIGASYGADLNAVALFPNVEPTDFGEFKEKFDRVEYFTEGIHGGSDSKFVEKTLLHIGECMVLTVT